MLPEEKLNGFLVAAEAFPLDHQLDLLIEEIER